jgi:hypothetical protein
MSNFLSHWYSSPAKRFAVSSVVIFAGSVLYSAFRGARFIGSVGVDAYLKDDGIFNLAHFHNYTPFYFAICALLYALVSANRLSPIPVEVHFWVSVVASLAVIYLAEQLIELPPTGWEQRFVVSARLFRFIQGLVFATQLLFVSNLVTGWLSRSRAQTSRTY